MAIYLVSGKLGSGKTLASVGRIRDCLRSGRRVATNLDLHLDKMLPARNKTARCVRLPDKPTVADLEALGCGNTEMDETKNGIIVLDELGSWLNSRTFNEKGRMPVIDWLLHSRKHGWDVFFICQHIEQIDKQIRTALVEYLVVCRRLDRLKIPGVGKLIKALSSGYLSGNMPKVHVATVRYGTDQNAIVADRWIYQAKDLYPAYNTRQVFSDLYADGVYSYLPPWHLGGFRALTLRQRWQAFVDRCLDGPERPKPDLKPKHPLAAMLGKLAPDEAVAHWRRLDALGAFDA